MTHTDTFLLCLLSAFTMAIPSHSAEPESPNLPSARIARWRGDARGAISLYYDDGTDSAFNIVRPALIQRHLPGTFYICCGWFKGADDPKLARWAEAFTHPEIVPGDHTWAHAGVTNVAQLADEITRNGALLRSLAKLPPDAPLSFALPGAVRWDITPEEQAACLAEHHEALRHDFGQNIGGPADMANFPVHTFEDALPALDRAERDGGWESFIFHGVGGDWLRFSAEEHERLLDELVARVEQHRLWVGPTMEVHLYEQERDKATLGVPKMDADGKGLTLDLTVEGDIPYAVPLTVVVDLPAEWSEVSVSCVSEGSKGAPTELRVTRNDEGKAVFDVPYASAKILVRTE